MQKIIVYLKNGSTVEIFTPLFRVLRDETTRRIEWGQHQLPGIPNLQMLTLEDVSAIISIADPPDDAPPAS